MNDEPESWGGTLVHIVLAAVFHVFAIIVFSKVFGLNHILSVLLAAALATVFVGAVVAYCEKE